MFRHITLPLVWPFIMVAAVIRLIDALKTLRHDLRDHAGRPRHVQRDASTSCSTRPAFAYYDLGYGSAIVVVFFVLILLISLLLLRVRQREAWR